VIACAHFPRSGCVWKARETRLRVRSPTSLGGGKIGFHQMTPMIGEYRNLRVTRVQKADWLRSDAT
jgi:hypothetical protein